MKRLVLVGLVVLVALAGCTTDDKTVTSTPTPSVSSSASPSPTNTGAEFLADLHAQFGDSIGSDDQLVKVAGKVCRDLGVSGVVVSDIVDFYTSPPTPVDKDLTVGVIVGAVKYYCPGYQAQVDVYLLSKGEA